MARRKPRLFAFPREVELAHLQVDGTVDSEVMHHVSAVIDAFAEIANTRSVRPEWLGPIAEAARHPDPAVRGLGLTRLSVLCHYFPEAVEHYAALTRDPDPSVRQFAVTVLANTPPTVVASLLPAALSDRDWGVRKAAATVAGALPLPELRPLFERHLTREADARVRVVLQLAVDHQHRVASA